MSETEERLVSDNTVENARGRDRERKKKRQLHEERRGPRGSLSIKEREKGGERKKGWKKRRARERELSLSLSFSVSHAHICGEEEARPKDEELCKKRDETGRIPRDKRRRGRRRRRNGGTKEDHAGDYNINKQMSLEAGEFAIQSGTGGGREAESPPTNLEGLTRTLAPSLDLSSPSPACLSSTKFLLLAHCLGHLFSFSVSLSPASLRLVLLRIQNATCTFRCEDNGALEHALVPLP